MRLGSPPIWPPSIERDAMLFIEVRSLAGINFIRASDVIAVQYSDREKCAIVLSGGVTLQCTESASAVAARVAAAVGATHVATVAQETDDGYAGK